jgi:hypothetical protein
MKEYLLTIDPGANTGIAIWHQRTLIRADLINLESSRDQTKIADLIAFRSSTPVRTVIEIPIVYLGSKSKVNPNDLIRLTYRAGALGGFEAETITPVAWKGNVPDEIIYNRILSKLSDEEKQVIPNRGKSVLHNTLDAIGIGLKKLGRL